MFTKPLICVATLLVSLAQLTRSVLFRETQATTDYLDQIVVLRKTTSKIHCGHSCIIAAGSDECAAFHFDAATLQCFCGRRMSFEMRITGSDMILHSNILCNKPSPPGNMLYYIQYDLGLMMKNPHFSLANTYLLACDNVSNSVQGELTLVGIKTSTFCFGRGPPVGSTVEKKARFPLRDTSFP